jgi:hypothetical protein
VITAEERALVEDWAHLVLPAGARDVQYHHERGADPAIWLRLTLPAAERDAFLAGAGYTKPLSPRTRYVTSAQLRQPWWRPDDVTPFESGHLLREDRRPRYGSNLLLGPAPDGDDDLLAYIFVTGL